MFFLAWWRLSCCAIVSKKSAENPDLKFNAGGDSVLYLGKNVTLIECKGVAFLNELTLYSFNAKCGLIILSFHHFP